MGTNARPHRSTPVGPAPTSRATERHLIAQVLAARTRGVDLIEIRGEPWCGKTELLSQAIADADAAGWTVTRVENRIGDPARADRPGKPASDADRLLIVMDDAHRATPATTALLERLLAEPPDRRLAVLVGYRGRQAPPALRGLLTQANPAVNSHRIALAPLPDEALDGMLPPTLNRATRRSLLAEAAGNPGVLATVYAAWAETGPDWAELAEQWPDDALRLPLADLCRLSANGWLVARSAAVLDEPADAGLLGAIAQLDGDEFCAALDELTAEDILRPTDGGRLFRFRHRLLRLISYSSAGPGWRLGAHTRAAAALAAGQAPLWQHADQLVQGITGPDGLGEEQGLSLSTAAELAIRHAPQRAVAWLRAMLPTLPAGSAELSVQQVLLGKALVICGRLDEGLAVLRKTTRRVPNAPMQTWAEAAEWRAVLYRLLGRHAEAQRQLRAALPALPRATQPWVLLHLADITTSLDRGGRPPALDDPVVHRWLGTAEPVLRGYALAVLAATDAAAGRVAQAADRASEAGALVDELTDDELAGRLDTLYWLGRAESHLEQDHFAAAHFERGLDMAAARDQTYLVPPLASGLAAALLRLGDVARASGHAEFAVAEAERVSAGSALATACAVQAQVAVAAGDPETTLTAARTALRRVTTCREAWADRVRLAVLDAVSTLGDPTLRDAVLETGVVERARAATVTAELPALGELLARVSIGAGATDRASNWAELAAGAAAVVRLPAATGMSMLARAHQLNANPPAAAAYAASAALALDRAGWRVTAARAQLTAAAAWSALADQPAARAELTEARTSLLSCGAHGYVATEPSPGTLAPQNPVPARLQALSGRELEVAVLVSNGYTNQQIARALELSHKTVETYLGRIFKKLEVISRAQVAALIGPTAPARHPASGGRR